MSSTRCSRSSRSWACAKARTAWRALKEAGREHKVVFIGHGLTPDTHTLLIDGSMDAVITQSPHTTLMNCVRILANLRDKREALSGVETTRSQVIFRENLP
jgi:LacI family transcriptional regulator